VRIEEWKIGMIHGEKFAEELIDSILCQTNAL
jgi:hypothetical protein